MVWGGSTPDACALSYYFGGNLCHDSLPIDQYGVDLKIGHNTFTLVLSLDVKSVIKSCKSSAALLDGVR